MMKKALSSKPSPGRPALSTVRRRGLHLLLPASVMLAACVGQVGEPVPTGLPDGDGGGDTGPGAGSKACATKGIGPAVLRRLTADELRSTVQDLAGIGIGDIQLQPDLEIAEFRSNAEAPTQWANAVDLRDIAEKVGMHLRNNVQQYAPCDTSDPANETACVDAFLDDFGKRAFRRPLAEEERERLHTLYQKAKKDHGLKYPGGIRLVTEAMLQSPPFAYHVELGMDVAPVNDAVPLTGHEMASRLSYFLAGSMPDQEMFAAAESGALASEEGIAAQVDRLLGTEAGRKHIDAFFQQWLGLHAVDNLTFDKDLYPAWTDATAAAMRSSTELLIDEVMWEGDGLYSTLLTSQVSYVNGPLAKVLGLEGDFGPDFERVELDATRRGILSHPSILAHESKPDRTSPVLRGRFVLQRLTCGSPPPPPGDLVVDELPEDPDLTTREKLESLTADATCQACHKYMNPVGFSMENYDAIGAYRETENNKPIDASGELLDVDVKGEYEGLGGLVARLSESNDAAVCAERKMMTFALGRDLVKGELCWLGDEYMEKLPEDLDFRELARAIATSMPFRMVKKVEIDQCD